MSGGQGPGPARPPPPGPLPCVGVTAGGQGPRWGCDQGALGGWAHPAQWGPHVGGGGGGHSHHVPLCWGKPWHRGGAYWGSQCSAMGNLGAGNRLRALGSPSPNPLPPQPFPASVSPLTPSEGTWGPSLMGGGQLGYRAPPPTSLPSSPSPPQHAAWCRDVPCPSPASPSHPSAAPAPAAQRGGEGVAGSPPAPPPAQGLGNKGSGHSWAPAATAMATPPPPPPGHQPLPWGHRLSPFPEPTAPCPVPPAVPTSPSCPRAASIRPSAGALPILHLSVCPSATPARRRRRHRRHRPQGGTSWVGAPRPSPSGATVEGTRGGWSPHGHPRWVPPQ